MRGIRKLEHIDCSLSLFKSRKEQLQSSEVRFIPRELPECNLTDVDISTAVTENWTWEKFLYLNASTGGTSATFPILHELAEVAASHQMAIAVGSQTAMIAEQTERCYRDLRMRHPGLCMIANAPASVSVNDLKGMVDSLQADMLQIHLNLAQEAIMVEGDRDFENYIANIASHTAALEIPIIIKGVGCGIARETLQKINHINYVIVDVAGSTGINFADVENVRRANKILGIDNWGITSYESLLEVKQFLGDKRKIFASGGIYTSSSAMKCIALGATAVGIITPILNYIIEKRYHDLDKYLLKYFEDSETILRMLGCQNLSQLQQVPLLITGSLKEYSQLRNIDILKYANR